MAELKSATQAQIDAEKRNERFNFILLTVLFVVASGLGLLAVTVAIGPPEVRILVAVLFWVIAAAFLGLSIRSLYLWLR